jgi:sugar phosphate permease
VVAALSTGALLEHYGWRTVIVLEGMLPFLWLPIWWFFIRDRPREAKWISAEERDYLETTLREEAAAVEPSKALSFWQKICQPLVVILIAINFFHNCLAYGCMTFFTSSLEARGSWTLSANEITDLSGVIDRLRRQSDPVSAYLWQRLSMKQQGMLTIYQPSVPRSNVDEGIVVDSLNSIIEGPAIYEPERFNSVSLRPETANLVQRSRAGPNLAQVNRLLLEDAYPLELSRIKGHGFSALQYGMLFAFPYTFTAVLMILVSRHSDKVNERRMHVGLTYLVSGLALILSVSLRNHFWWSYAFLCVSIPGPSVALSPFWAIPSETLPRSTRGALMGLVNACGNLGGFVGPFIAGWLKKSSGSLELSFDALALGILIAACLTYWLPKTAPVQRP